MKKWFKKLNETSYGKFTDFLTEGGFYIIFVIALVAMSLLMLGFYGKHGFDWRWFAFFHLPLYIFCGWALWQTLKMYRKMKKNKQL